LTWAKKQTCNNWYSNIDSTDSDNNNNLFIDADNEELYHSINDVIARMAINNYQCIKHIIFKQVDRMTTAIYFNEMPT